MSTPEQIAGQIRFALSNLPAQNAHYSFEQLCRFLARQRLCSNVLPATGPVAAGGDHGRDFETFRTYLRGELGPHGAFLGLVDEGPIAFVCTTQQDGVRRKIRSDVDTVCASGTAVQAVYAFCSSDLPVAARHALREEVGEAHDIALEVLDGHAIAELLATRDTFWIAERFLMLPAELEPSWHEPDEELPEWYLESRARRREQEPVERTLGELLSIKDGLRFATTHLDARGDLPFWLELVGTFVDDHDLSLEVLQRARYELAVASLRGTGNLTLADDVVRAYFHDVASSSEPVRLRDAAVLLMYVFGARQREVTALDAETILRWNQELQDIVSARLESASPTNHATLLWVRGLLGLHPNPALLHDGEPGRGTTPGDAERVGPGTATGESAFVDLDLGMAAWSQLADGLSGTPLFPVAQFADQLGLLAPLLVDRPEWRSLVDHVDEAFARVAGQSAAAERARDRAVALLQAERVLEALHELHSAKIGWLTGDTLRGSVLSMLTIADCYLVLRMPLAAKAHALGAADVALRRGEDDLLELVPAGFRMAAQAEILGGAWVGAVEISKMALQAQYALGEGDLDIDGDPALQHLLANLVQIAACARDCVPSVVAPTRRALSMTGVADLVDELLEAVPARTAEEWAGAGGEDLVCYPFADVGFGRTIRFAALGVSWVIRAPNEFAVVRAAERLAAAAQILLVELAQSDPCFLPTDIEIAVEMDRGDVPSDRKVVSLPSNEGRRWVVRLLGSRTPDDLATDEVNHELIGALAIILSEVSLLQGDAFLAIVEDAFRRGLAHKLSPGRIYDEVANCVNASEYDASGHHGEAPIRDFAGGDRIERHQLAWRRGPGPGYSLTEAEELLRNRYDFFAGAMNQTVPRLRDHPPFAGVVRELRSRGWLDWHLLTAIVGILTNHRQPLRYGQPPSVETQRTWYEEARRAEDESTPLAPLDLFTAEAMDEHRILSMMSTVKIWGLECRQNTPDIPAIERVLKDRFGYWEDDIPHADPFPEAH